jgi:hypothetical protein
MHFVEICSSFNVNTNGTIQWPPCLKWLWKFPCIFIHLWSYGSRLPCEWSLCQCPSRVMSLQAVTLSCDYVSSWLSAGGGTWTIRCVTLWKVRTVFDFPSSIKHNSVTHRNKPISLGVRQLWVYECRFTVFKNKVELKIVQLRKGK